MGARRLLIPLFATCGVATTHNAAAISNNLDTSPSLEKTIEQIYASEANDGQLIEATKSVT